MKIVAPRAIRIPAKYVHKLKELGTEIYVDLEPSPQEILDRIKDAEVVISFYNDNIDKVIYDAPKLKYFISTAAGYERINLDRMQNNGVTVINCPLYNSQAVAEHAVALMFAVMRKIILANESLKAGEWQDEEFSGMEIAGKKVGLVGYGNIGKKIAAIIAALDTELKFVNTKSSEQDLDKILAESDVIFLSTPLNNQTKHIIGEERLKLLKPTAILINVARGALIDQKALYKTLKNKKIMGAGLDVFEGEPSSSEVSEQILQLVNLPDVVATPHIAYNTKESADKLGRAIIANLEACIKGRPINVVGKSL